jgi:hypothetical protein
MLRQGFLAGYLYYVDAQTPASQKALNRFPRAYNDARDSCFAVAINGRE